MEPASAGGTAPVRKLEDTLEAVKNESPVKSAVAASAPSGSIAPPSIPRIVAQAREAAKKVSVAATTGVPSVKSVVPTIEKPAAAPSLPSTEAATTDKTPEMPANTSSLPPKPSSEPGTDKAVSFAVPPKDVDQPESQPLVLPAQAKNNQSVKQFMMDGKLVRETRVTRTETQVTIVADEVPKKDKKTAPEVCFSMCAPRKVMKPDVTVPVQPPPPVKAAPAPPPPAPAPPPPVPAPILEPTPPPAPVVKAAPPVIVPVAPPAPPPTEVAAFLAIPRPRVQFDEKRAAWLIRLPAADVCMQRGVYSQHELVLQLRWFGTATTLNKPALIAQQDPSTTAAEGMIAYEIPMSAAEGTRDVPGFGKCLLVRLSHQNTPPSSEFQRSGLLVLPVQIQSQTDATPPLKTTQLLTTGGTLPIIRTLPDPVKEIVPEPPKPAPAVFRFPAGFHESTENFVYALVGEPAKVALVTGDAFVKLLVKVHPTTPGTRSVYAEIDSEQFNLSYASFPCVEFCIPKSVGKLDGQGGVVVDGLWPLDLPLPAHDAALLMCLRTHSTAQGLSFAQGTVSIPKEIKCACFVLSTYDAPAPPPPTIAPDDATLTLPLQNVASIGGGCFTASLPNELFSEVAVPGECVRVVIASSYFAEADTDPILHIRIRATEIKLSTAGHFVWRAAVCNVLRDRRHRIQQFTWPVGNSAQIADPWFQLAIPRIALDRDANGDGIVNLRIPDVATPAHQVPHEGGVSNDFGFTSMEELLASIPAEVHHRMVLLHVSRTLLAEIEETLSFFLQPTSTDPALMLLHLPVVFPTIMQYPLECRVRAQSKCNRDDLVRVQLPSEGVLNIPGAPTIGIPFLMAAAPEEIAGDLYVDVSVIENGTVILHGDPVARKAFFVPRFTEVAVPSVEPEKPRARLQVPLLLENERTKRFAFPKRLFSQTSEATGDILTVLFHPSMVSFHSTYGWGVSFPEAVMKQHGRDNVLALDIFHLETEGDAVTITCPSLPAGPSPARVYFPPTVIKGVPLDCAYFAVALRRDELTRQTHETSPAAQSPLMETASPQVPKSLVRSKSPATKVVRGFLADLFSGTSLTTEGDLTVREPAAPRSESAQLVSPSKARIWWSLDRFSTKKSLKMEEAVSQEASPASTAPVSNNPPVEVKELSTSPMPPPPPPSARRSSMSPGGQQGKIRVVSTHVHGPVFSPMDGYSSARFGGRRY